ncbi:MAG TPA: hypothetical protein DER23_05025 [Clostridiales bacterium]|jgi:hypothetical protein|nr:hypothetical protein [Clostridiales bacterium]HCG35690.1 hypothetical protein [Clostridiales bacterium]
MTVRQLADAMDLEILCLCDPDAQVTGAYAGDLLSWVMGHAKSGDAWLTVMTNINVIAVASLTGVACTILGDDAVIDDEIIQTASTKGVNLLRSKRSVFALCHALYPYVS